MKYEPKWTQTEDDRRCELIGRQIAGTISISECTELANLQKAAERYFDQVASPDVDGAVAVYQELLDRLGR
ncbi:hypothetical protein SH528x_003869 [Novipirellula sp. SH528]|uniref:hypothetical protein n=1 Tax=Novipirellula sp. SH528 TaxID=3454466 RepID=UPI003FA10D3B